MRTAGAIRQKLKQVKFRHLKKILGNQLAIRPENCVHNTVLDLPENGSEPLRICACESVKGTDRTCDVRHGGLQRAKECPFFEIKRSKDDIKADYTEFFETASHGQIAYLYPDAAALIWALGDEASDVGEVDTDEEEVEPEEEPQRPSEGTLEGLAAEPDPAPLEEVQALLESLESRVRDEAITRRDAVAGLDRRIAALQEGLPDVRDLEAAHAGRGARIDGLASRLDAVEGRLPDGLAARVERAVERLDAVEGRLPDGLVHRVEHLEAQYANLATRVAALETPAVPARDSGWSLSRLFFGGSRG